MAAGRRLAFIDQDAVVKVAEAGAAGMTLAQVEARRSLTTIARAAMLSLLWFGHWTTDLSRPLWQLHPADGAGRGMTGASYDLRVGGRVWLDGQGWEVAEALRGARDGQRSFTVVDSA